jgi:hypothetical protein
MNSCSITSAENHCTPIAKKYNTIPNKKKNRKISAETYLQTFQIINPYKILIQLKKYIYSK